MKRQRGLTLIGFIFILIIAGFFALMAMKLVPSYVEYMGVVKSMKQVAAEPGVAHKSVAEIKADLDFKASFQYADSAIEGKNRLRIVRNHHGRSDLVIDYNKKIHFLYNIFFLLHFSKTVPLNAASG